MSSAPCSDFIQDIVFTDQPQGGITAKKLNLAWTDGQVAPCFVQRQPEIAGVLPTDYFLVLRADGTYAKVSAVSALSQTGQRGSVWTVDMGDPTGITAPQIGDQYLDFSSGDVWEYSFQTGDTDPTTAPSRGSLWFDASGAPGTIANIQIQDQYLNTANADVYQCTAAPLTEATMVRGSYWFDASGAPGTVSTQQVQDQYLDTASADIWQYR